MIFREREILKSRKSLWNYALSLFFQLNLNLLKWSLVSHALMNFCDCAFSLMLLFCFLYHRKWFTSNLLVLRFFHTVWPFAFCLCETTYNRKVSYKMVSSRYDLFECKLILFISYLLITFPCLEEMSSSSEIEKNWALSS